MDPESRLGQMGDNMTVFGMLESLQVRARKSILMVVLGRAIGKTDNLLKELEVK